MNFFYLLIFFSLLFLAGLFINYKTQTVRHGIILFFSVLTLSVIKYSFFGLQDDERTYHLYAMTYKSQISDLPSFFNTSFSDGKELYIILLGFLYWLFLSDPYLGFLINSFFFMTLPSILYKTFINFKLPVKPNVTLCLLIFSPIFLWSLGLSREPIAFFLIVLYLYCLSLLYNNNLRHSLIIFVPLMLVVTNFRSLLFPFLLFGFAIFIVNYFLKDLSLLLKQTLVLPAILALIILTLVSILFILIYIYRFIKLNFSGVINELANPTFTLYVERSSSDFNFSLYGFVYNLPRSMFGPYITEFNNPALVFFAIEGLYYGFIFSLVLLFLFYSNNRQLSYLFLLSIIPFILMNNFYITNYGLNSRIKAHILLMIFPLLYFVFLRIYQRLEKSYESR
jgi:hypothetical protein